MELEFYKFPLGSIAMQLPDHPPLLGMVSCRAWLCSLRGSNTYGFYLRIKTLELRSSKKPVDYGPWICPSVESAHLDTQARQRFDILVASKLVLYLLPYLTGHGVPMSRDEQNLVSWILTERYQVFSW